MKGKTVWNYPDCPYLVPDGGQVWISWSIPSQPWTDRRMVYKAVSSAFYPDKFVRKTLIAMLNFLYQISQD